MITEQDEERGDWEADVMKDRLMEEAREERRAAIPTPRTDAAVVESKGQWSYKLREVSRQLEREVVELRKQLQEAHRERDNAISDHKQADTDTLRALHERNEARRELEEAQNRAAFFESAMCVQGDHITKITEQRDELAEALRAVAANPGNCSGRNAPCFESGLIAKEALAAVEGGRHE